MSRMVRKQIYLEAAQDAILKQRAQELGVSEASLIRRCLESVGDQMHSLPLDKQAWSDELAFLKARLQTVLSRAGRRTWTREDLYAERRKGVSG